LAVLLEGVFILKNMYLPKKENLEKLNKLYNSVNWDLEYDKRFIRDENKKKNINYEKRINPEKEIIENYYLDLFNEYNCYIKLGGTEFGFKLYLTNEKFLFKCRCCKQERCVNDIEILFLKKEIIIGLCKNCNPEKYKNNEIDENLIQKKLNAFRHTTRRKTDPIYKFKGNVRSLISCSFKRTKGSNWEKKLKSEEILGCDLDFFRNYIESKFTEGMTLYNYGRWHLDHIKPIFLAKSELEIIQFNHYTNFQPLWAIDNIIKRAKY